MRALKAIWVFVVVVILAGLAYIYSGIYNVAASSGHGPFEIWLFSTVSDYSVRRHATDVVMPPSLPSPDTGFQTFHKSCVGCHGAPGVERSPVGKGLTPRAPDLKEAGEEWSPAELFWVVKHGIKFTGMPAWGATRRDDQLWKVVAFVKQLPNISAEQYREMSRRLERKPARGS